MANFAFVQGRVTGSPDYYEAPDGHVRRLKYRIAMAREGYQPARGRGNADYLTVVREVRKDAGPLDELFLRLDRAYIRKGTEVAVVGWIRSRDVGVTTSTELVALAVAYLGGINPRGNELMTALAGAK
ncbi:MAG TPA: hypothetical protein EYP49_11255 [Anaerolineae bacterium]|nr:hypothetical protein [Anaerolineae bacterium]